MKLRDKVFLLIIGAFLLLTGGSYVIARFFIMRSFSELEKSRTRRNIERVLKFINYEQKNITAMTREWMSKQGFRILLSGELENRQDIHSLMDASLVNLEMDLMILFDGVGNPELVRAFDHETKSVVEIPEDFINRLQSERSWMQPFVKQNNIMGFLNTPFGHMIVAVLKNKRSGDDYQYILVGRNLDAGKTVQIGNTTLTSVSVLNLNNNNLPADMIPSLKNSENLPRLSIQTLSPESMAGYYLAEDIFRDPAFVIKTTIPRDIYLQGLTGVNYFFLSLLIITLFMGLFLVLLLDKSILSRLSLLMKDLYQVGMKGEPSGRVKVSGNDEISAVGGAINKMLHALEFSRNQQLEIRGRMMLLSHMVESISEIATVTDMEDRFVFVNKAFCEVYGYSEQEVIGKHVSMLLAPENPPGLIDEVMEKTRHGGWRGEILNITRDGRVFPVELSTSRITDSEGDFIGLAGISMDISERKQSEEMLRERAERAVRYQRALLQIARMDKTRMSRILPLITEIASRTIDVERVGFWRIDHNRNELACMDLFTLSSGKHHIQDSLTLEKYSRYLESLRENRVLSAEKAQESVYFQEFGDEYLRKNSITSMLDVPVWVHGELVGVVCHEHTGPERKWTPEEEDFAASIADMISLSVVSEERAHAEETARAFARLGRNLSEVRTHREAGVHIGDTAKEIFGWDAFFLVVYWEDRDEIIPVYNVDTVDGKHIEFPFSYKTGKPGPFIHRAVKDGAFLVLREKPDEEISSFPFGDVDKASASLMFAPVRSGGKAVGVLSVQSYSCHKYSDADLSLLQSFGDHCGGAMFRIRAEENLRESEEKYRRLFNTGNDVIFVHGIEEDGTPGNFIEVNDVACRVLGYSRSELLNMGPVDIEPVEYQKHIPETVKKLKIKNQLLFETVHRTKNGEEFPVEINAHIFELSGEPVVLSIARNITKRKEAEKNLRQKNLFLSIQNRVAKVTAGRFTPTQLCDRLLEVIQSALPCDALYIDSYSEGDNKLYGIRAYDTVNDEVQVVENIDVPFDKDQSLNTIVLRNRQPLVIHRTTEEMRHLQTTPFGDANRISASILTVPLIVGNRVIGVMSVQSYQKNVYSEEKVEIFLAIARQTAPALRRVQAEEELRNAHAKLRKAMDELKKTQEQIIQQERLAAVGQLAAGVAHDLNNQLQAISGYTEIALLREDLDDTVHDALDTVLKQTDRASHLIRQILDFSRKSVMEKSRLNLLPFLKEIIKLLKRTIPENIHISFNHQSGEYIVNADPTRLQQVIMNLCVNARDAMPEGGEIELELRTFLLGENDTPPYERLTPGKWVCIRVSDSGPGIDNEILPHIFEPFFSTKDPTKGTGLGLAQVYGIVKQHDGFIDVRSRENEGSSFWVYLPSEEEEDILHEKTSGITYRGGGETIFVVEDESVVLDVTRMLLENLGYKVIGTTSPQTALEIYRDGESEIDLLLVDMVMPEMNGEVLLRELNRHHENVRAVLMTGYPLKVGALDLDQLGIVEWVQKPVSRRKLARAIHHALRM